MEWEVEIVMKGAWKKKKALKKQAFNDLSKTVSNKEVVKVNGLSKAFEQMEREYDLKLTN